MSNKRLRLRADERVLDEVRPSRWWTLGFYLFSLGLWSFWRRRHRYVLTNQRLIAVKGIVTKSERVLPLERIQDLSVRTSPLSGGRIAVSTAGGSLGFESIPCLTQAKARSFADAIQLAVRDLRVSATAQPAPYVPLPPPLPAPS